MRSNSYSRTAELTAMIRAWHFLYDDRPLIFEDPVAIDLLGPKLREYCYRPDEQRPGRGGSAAIILGRSRYAEDNLEEALEQGCRQYVLLGAGGDTFALRRPDLIEKIRVYEIDQPATQKWKQDRLNEQGWKLPDTCKIIPADLLNETVLDALDRSSFKKDQRVFLSWLGTTMYLTPKAIFSTLNSLAKVLAPGSEIIFDYRVKTEFIDPLEVEFVLAGDQATAKMGEPKLSFFNPHTLADKIKAVGFEVVENMSPEQLTRRYVCARNDVERPTSHHWYMHVRLPS